MRQIDHDGRDLTRLRIEHINEELAQIHAQIVLKNPNARESNLVATALSRRVGIHYDYEHE
jgi:hypothetical protein